MSRTRKDNRPPKELRVLRKGDVGADGRLFWQYAKDYTNGEWWVSPSRFDELRAMSRAINQKYKKSGKGKLAQNKYESKQSLTKPSFKIARRLRDRVRSAIKAGKSTNLNLNQR